MPCKNLPALQKSALPCRNPPCFVGSAVSYRQNSALPYKIRHALQESALPCRNPLYHGGICPAMKEFALPWRNPPLRLIGTRHVISPTWRLAAYMATKWLSFHLDTCHVDIFLPQLKINSHLTISSEQELNWVGKWGGLPPPFDNLVYSQTICTFDVCAH